MESNKLSWNKSIIKYNFTNKIIAYVKVKGGNLITLATKLTFIVSCALL